MPPAAVVTLYRDYLAPLLQWIQCKVPPGPRCMKVCYAVNLQKGGTALFVLYLMRRYKAFNNPAAWAYLSLHGTYGFLWLLKERIFPDPGWQQKCTVGSSLAQFATILGPYWLAPYLLISRGVRASPRRIALATALHTLGCVAMMAADTQKFFVLRERRGLIKDGWFARCRNTNYLAEMGIYSSYAILAQHPAPWAILAYVWSLLFAKNMVLKEESLKRKDGYEEYAARSGLLFPWVF